MIDLLEAPEQVENFFVKHPESLVLVQEKSIDMIFADDPDAWNKRVLRELRVGKTLYLVVKKRPVN